MKSHNLMVPRVAEQNSCDAGRQLSTGINFSALEVRKISVSALH